MVNALSAEDVVAVRDVIEHSTLSRVTFDEVAACRHAQPPDEDADGRLTIQVQQRVGEGEFGVRLKAHAELAWGEAHATVVGEYTLLDGTTPTRRVLQLFTNEVAVMTIYPYLREAIATITAKVFGESIHLPIVSRGEIAVKVDGEQEDS